MTPTFDEIWERRCAILEGKSKTLENNVKGMLSEIWEAGLDVADITEDMKQLHWRDVLSNAMYIDRIYAKIMPTISRLISMLADTQIWVEEINADMLLDAEYQLIRESDEQEGA